MTSVFNYVSPIVDALTAKLPGFQYCFLLAVEGGAELQKWKLWTIQNRSKKNKYTVSSSTCDRLRLLFMFLEADTPSNIFAQTTTAR